MGFRCRSTASVRHNLYEPHVCVCARTYSRALLVPSSSSQYDTLSKSFRFHLTVFCCLERSQGYYRRRATLSIFHSILRRHIRELLITPDDCGRPGGIYAIDCTCFLFFSSVLYVQVFFMNRSRSEAFVVKLVHRGISIFLYSNYFSFNVYIKCKLASIIIYHNAQVELKD